jgi:hypothetical protein
MKVFFIGVALSLLIVMFCVVLPTLVLFFVFGIDIPTLFTTILGALIGVWVMDWVEEKFDN